MVRPWLLVALLGRLLIGCGNDLAYENAVDGGGGGSGSADADHPSAQGELPCDVQTLLADHCQSCHGKTPSNGAPISLVTYADLTATAAAGGTVAQRALARIKSTSARMPPLPAPAVSGAEIASFEGWVNAGAPSGDCTAMPGPFDGPPVCTSGRTWTGGNNESPLMHPGRACISCHASSGDGASPQDGAPRFTIAGTIYPTGHEPNECYGATSGVVEVTDAGGNVTRLSVNAAGNFFTTAAIAAPIHVAVVANGRRRAMGASPPRGDCNSCHTQSGANGAPGRIALP